MNNSKLLVSCRPFALRVFCDIVFVKMKVNDFAFEKRLVGHILNKIIVNWILKYNTIIHKSSISKLVLIC